MPGVSDRKATRTAASPVPRLCGARGRPSKPFAFARRTYLDCPLPRKPLDSNISGRCASRIQPLELVSLNKRGWRRCGTCSSVRSTGRLAKRVAAALVALSVALAGCGVSTEGHAAQQNATPPKPPIAAAALDGLLLSTGEIKSLTASAVVEKKRETTMVDDADNIAERPCVAIESATEDRIYKGSGWIAVRRQEFAEPGDDHDHFVDQAVVSFPTPHDSAAFMTASAEGWAACANRRYHYTDNGDPDNKDLFWTVGPVSDAAAILSTTKTEEGADGWNCQRALTSTNNVVVDVVACSYSQTDSSAVTIARRIRDKVSN